MPWLDNSFPVPWEKPEDSVSIPSSNETALQLKPMLALCKKPYSAYILKHRHCRVKNYRLSWILHYFTRVSSICQSVHMSTHLCIANGTITPICTAHLSILRHFAGCNGPSSPLALRHLCSSPLRVDEYKWHRGNADGHSIDAEISSSAETLAPRHN